MIHESVESNSLYFDTLKMPVLGVSNRTFTDILLFLNHGCNRILETVYPGNCCKVSKNFIKFSILLTNDKSKFRQMSYEITVSFNNFNNSRSK